MNAYSIVGTSHRKSDKFLGKLKIGTPVVLVLEPTNAFDPMAIMVWIDGKHVGYIPRSQNRALSQYIEQVGEDWLVPNDKDPGEIHKAISGRFLRSPNSAFPMVEVKG